MNWVASDGYTQGIVSEPETHTPQSPPSAPAPFDGGPSAAPSSPGPGSTSASAPAVGLTVDDVMDALSNVIDPELGLDFVELGLIYGVEVDDGDVCVTFTLTTPGCPIGPQVTEQIEEFVGELEGVKTIQSEMVFTPPWTPEKMSEDAKFALGY
jgi:metal-sulfur cluster biosynthetic enzyme